MGNGGRIKNQPIHKGLVLPCHQTDGNGNNDNNGGMGDNGHRNSAGKFLVSITNFGAIGGKFWGRVGNWGGKLCSLVDCGKQWRGFAV